MKNKHVYLIIAHNEFEILKILLSMLDDERNDIYLHFDKKVDNIDINIEELQLRNSKLFILDERIDVRWGDLSQIKTELLLFEAAYNNGEYAYYHLLSGVDLPIKTQDYIHQFFNDNNGFEFVGYLWNSDLRNHIYNPDDEFAGCMRAIDWNRGDPYVWRNEDFQELKDSDKLFARKFSSKQMDIVRKIQKEYSNMVS